MINNKPKLVFLVEDEEDHAKVFQMGIARSDTGAECETFTSGDNLYQKLQNLNPEAKPDLMLLDLNLPDTDGFHVLERVRSIYPREKLPVVVFSSSSS